MGLGATLPNHIPACRSELMNGTGFDTIAINCGMKILTFKPIHYKMHALRKDKINLFSLLSSIFYWWDQEANGGGGSLTEGSIDRLKILKTCSAGSPTLGDTS